MQNEKNVSKYVVGTLFESSLGGTCEIIEYRNSKEVLIRFLNTGYETWVQTSKVYSGMVRDNTLPTVCGVGFNNSGKYPATEFTERGTRLTKAYSTWNGMLKRCYDEAHRHKSPTYSGCTVHASWHYYQEYARFFYEDPYRQDGWHIEKDILVKGNKEYGPETCVFAPIEINSFVNKLQNTRGDLPLGVSYKKANKRYSSCCRDGAGKLIHLGYFSNPEDAFLAFKEKKEDLARIIADRWKNQIDPRLYHALYNYTVEITD